MDVLVITMADQLIGSIKDKYLRKRMLPGHPFTFTVVIGPWAPDLDNLNVFL